MSTVSFCFLVSSSSDILVWINWHWHSARADTFNIRFGMGQQCMHGALLQESHSYTLGFLSIKQLFRQEVGFRMRITASICPHALPPISAGVWMRREQPFRQTKKNCIATFAFLQNLKIKRLQVILSDAFRELLHTVSF